MNQPQTILLIGLRGSGKSTLGRLIADRIGVSFIDLDEFTLKRMGYQSVTEAWAQEGESVFRASEIEALRTVINGQCVIALGGGTPMAPGGEDVIRASGAISIYLRGKPALLRERLASSMGDDRPSLTGIDPLDEIEQVFQDRDPQYTALADHIVELSAQEQPDETLARLLGIVE